MNAELRKLRAEVRRAPKNKRGFRRIPVELRARILDAMPREARRRDYIEFAEQLGLSVHTMLGWRERERKRSPRRTVRRVETECGDAAATAPASALSAVLPGGVRIEGLSMAHAIELARVLS